MCGLEFQCILFGLPCSRTRQCFGADQIIRVKTVDRPLHETARSSEMPSHCLGTVRLKTVSYRRQPNISQPKVLWLHYTTHGHSSAMRHPHCRAPNCWHIVIVTYMSSIKEEQQICFLTSTNHTAVPAYIATHETHAAN